MIDLALNVVSSEIALSVQMGGVTIIGGDGGGGGPGEDGASAYDDSFGNGFVGTQSVWLLSLKGAQGVQGLQGDPGPQGATGAAGIAGQQGIQGEQGIQGVQGPQGAGGAAIDTLPLEVAVTDTAVDSLAVVIDGVPSRMAMDDFIEQNGVELMELQTATTPAGGDYQTIFQNGEERKVLLSTMATFYGAAPDVQGPTLTSPTGAQTGTSTASGGVTTNEANGTLYYRATINATETATSVKTGATQAITTSGAKTVTVSDLISNTQYYLHYLHRDAAGNDSAVVTSASFTTASSGDSIAPTLSAPLGTQTGTSTASGGVTTNEANGTLYRLASTSATATDAAVKAANLTTTVSASGAISVSLTGLTANTQYYNHYLHRDAAGNDSAVVSSSAYTTASAATTTITPFTSGNTIKTTLAGSAAQATFGTIRYFNPDQMMTTPATYWNFSPWPATAKMGWGLSNTIPPDEITAAQNVNTGSSVNGLMPMTVRTNPSHQDDTKLWVPATGPSGPWYKWAKAGSEAPQCLNAGAGLMIT